MRSPILFCCVLWLILSISLSDRLILCANEELPEGLTVSSLNEPELLNNASHRSTVFRYLRLKTLDLFLNDPELRRYDHRWNLARLQVALRIFSNPEVRNFWLFLIMRDQIENYGIKDIQPLMTLFMKNCTDRESQARIQELYREDENLRKGHLIRVYKTADGFRLEAHIFSPTGPTEKSRRPAIVFFHGGSWYQGKVEWMFEACKKYASLGMIAVAAEYRLYDRHGSTPIECISDAKSVIRWLRKSADSLGIDPDRIAAYGFSAGGHLAASAAILSGFDEPGEDLSISSAPNALLFASSCFDPTLDNWFVQQVKERRPPESCSPIHHVRADLPPSLVVHGTQDTYCPYPVAQTFVEKMKKKGNQMTFVTLEGAGHFYFQDPEHRLRAGKAMTDFLTSIGYLRDPGK